MRILVDSCVAQSVVLALRQAGHEIEWVPEWGKDPGDELILQHAHRNNMVLFTRDKDFGTLIFRDGLPHRGLVRLAGEMSYAQQAERSLEVLKSHQGDLESGDIVTIEADRVRISNRSRAQ